jgi:hypothetical protein
MLKKIMTLVFCGAVMLNLSGCFLFVAGVAGGAGTAMWLSGKLTQEFHSPYQQTIDASKRALESLKLPVSKETREENVAQIRSVYTDGKEVWIDIHRVADTSTKVEVRVGAVNPDKLAAGQLLRKIESFL